MNLATDKTLFIAEIGGVLMQKRFERHFCIDASGCWLWTGAINSSGYGSFAIREGGRPKTDNAARISWKLYRGAIPEGSHVLHACDVRRCVNPDHLFLGTNQDNTRDKAIKGRGVRSRKGLPYGVAIVGSGRYQAQVGVAKDGARKNYYLGIYETPEEAHAVAVKFKQEWLEGSNES